MGQEREQIQSEYCSEIATPTRLKNGILNAKIERRTFLFGSGLALLGLGIACSSRGSSEISETAGKVEFEAVPCDIVDNEALSTLNEFELDFFVKQNDERTKRGLCRLVADSDLIKIARKRNSQLSNDEDLTHYSSSGEPAFRLLMDREHYPYGDAGENLSRNNYPNSQTIDVAITDLMNSDGHRSNILNKYYDHVGVGFSNKNSMKYVTTIFAQRIG